ncbi:DNA polymerase IV [Candidatus Desulfarcum epimagneticum]|uniref:DNA polymerase IV n=1 Tax=uncultured Desulfobacteraceae bacterium TaxID=218296 RepID=A0A484HCS3_9BACT|nr:DNA polymerase IV [uncultured Desulfobacteraceae bacterium]
MILHIDMDAFYASVERLDNPALKGLPLIVGGLSKRSVVAAASYEARRFGVHSAMPIFMAREKCPQAVILPPRMRRYKEVSRKVMAILNRFSPLVEAASIDEAYVDAAGCRRLFGTPKDMAAEVKSAVEKELGLTCSVGVAENKFLAKIASDLEKPDGLTLVPREKSLEFIQTLPLEKVPGVGRETRKRLKALGAVFLGDIGKLPGKTLEKKMGKAGARLEALSRCLDPSPVKPHRFPKSVSAEKTLMEDTADLGVLNACLLKQSGDLARELRRLKVKAKTVSIKIKHADFTLVTRSRSLPAPVQSSRDIFTESSRLLQHYPLSQKARLIGVSASGFVAENAPVQMELFPAGRDERRAWEKLDRAVDAIYEKHGREVVKMASNLNPRNPEDTRGILKP